MHADLADAEPGADGAAVELGVDQRAGRVEAGWSRSTLLGNQLEGAVQVRDVDAEHRPAPSQPPNSLAFRRRIERIAALDAEAGDDRVLAGQRQQLSRSLDVELAVAVHVEDVALAAASKPVRRAGAVAAVLRMGLRLRTRGSSRATAARISPVRSRLPSFTGRIS